MTMLYRQGDVLIRRIDKIPLRNHALPEDDNPQRLILAHGEATGHAHTITAKPSEARLRQKDEVRTTWGVVSAAQTFLEVLSPTGVTLTHDEHDPIQLDEGAYEVTRQREYDPEAARREARVRD